jgi:protein-L-isoaspartate(D-aspartate) O-methyltransferase
MSQEDVQLAELLAERGIRDLRVLAAMARLNRSDFLPQGLQAQAGEDTALPIGHGQTISQPFVVAYMTDALGLVPGERVLEVGTGSGYQAAVLLGMGANVYSIERVPELMELANARLRRIPGSASRLHLRVGDGYGGWPEEAPFDAILVTAAAARVPPALLQQLAQGGRLIAPVGADDEAQRLVLVRQGPAGLEQEWLLPVRFVPLVPNEALRAH